MKIPWNMILRSELQEILNRRLRVFQKPFLWFIIWVAPLLNVLMWIDNIKKKRYLDLIELR